ncbi:zinc-finger of the MIZ type in nse subunit [Hirsutella rhossiliensis]|uniref:Zinc-finger of the MIZ type in nse subunit domain-containing protein n=1 Tax=Hirsutella rhossiliensis TaxID=111463 RepID=A0A9P8MUT4_9HYPO|nr:zinc-finger of the MIZ type in nse subunit domain-containing protein [Hirsutella rhossiliensis]KAH0961630.1 zinc-finger of the MIZ type in nse subunit domain-containing protein [Hirsutella rhossiliensis]
MPRLVNSGTASLARLPEYEPPACPLDDNARRALGDLSNNRGTRFYEAQLKDLVRQLGLGVGDINERLAAQLERLEALRNRRQEKGSDKTDEEARLEAHLLQFESDVDALTRDAECAVRDVIDKRAELEDEAAVVADLYTTVVTRDIDASAQRRQRRAAEEEEEEENEAEQQDRKQDPVPSTLDAFRERRALKLAEYSDQLTPAQRYARNNDYAGFKKLWHDAATGEDGPALPDASKWFRSNGQPVMDRPGAATRRSTVGAGPDDDDDDIAVAREVLSIKCPLTLRPMDEPFSNSKCKHTFEKSAIRDYLPAQGVVQCPQTGCSETFSRAMFSEDFYLDQAMLRRIQRARQAQRNDKLDGIDDDDDIGDADGDMMVRGQRAVRGRAPKAERLSRA